MTAMAGATDVTAGQKRAGGFCRAAQQKGLNAPGAGSVLHSSRRPVRRLLLTVGAPVRDGHSPREKTIQIHCLRIRL